MFSNFQIIFIISTVSFTYSKSLETYEIIKNDFQYCQSSSQAFKIDTMCENTHNRNQSEIIECIKDLKNLKTEILENNEFIETKHNNKVIYLSNGEYFHASCRKIETIYIPRIIDKFTKDIFLYFYDNGIKTYGFLSAFGIIKSESYQEACNEIYSTIQIGNFQFIKYKNMIKANNLLPISEALKKKLEDRVEQKLADLMISSINSKNPYMVALACLSVFTFLLVILMVSLLNTRKKKSLLDFLFR